MRDRFVWAVIFVLLLLCLVFLNNSTLAPFIHRRPTALTPSGFPSPVSPREALSRLLDSVPIAIPEGSEYLVAEPFIANTPGLHEILLRGSWRAVNLTTLDHIADAIDRYNLVQYEEGHSAQLVIERQLYVKLAQMPHVKTICEVGFNAGHSAALWLWANPTAKVIMFDIWRFEYSATGEEFLRSVAAENYGLVNVNSRLIIVKGNSLTTVPSFAAKHSNVTCDIISIDGGHAVEVALADIGNMMALANENTILAIDDTNCVTNFCFFVGIAILEHRKQGHLRVLARASEKHYSRGVTILTYTTPRRRRRSASQKNESLS